MKFCKWSIYIPPFHQTKYYLYSYFSAPEYKHDRYENWCTYSENMD
jgi:hypothetical protein